MEPGKNHLVAALVWDSYHMYQREHIMYPGSPDWKVTVLSDDLVFFWLGCSASVLTQTEESDAKDLK